MGATHDELDEARPVAEGGAEVLNGEEPAWLEARVDPGASESRVGGVSARALCHSAGERTSDSPPDEGALLHLLEAPRAVECAAVRLSPLRNAVCTAPSPSSCCSTSSSCRAKVGSLPPRRGRARQDRVAAPERAVVGCVPPARGTREARRAGEGRRRGRRVRSEGEGSAEVELCEGRERAGAPVGLVCGPACPALLLLDPVRRGRRRRGPRSLNVRRRRGGRGRSVVGRQRASPRRRRWVHRA